MTGEDQPAKHSCLQPTPAAPLVRGGQSWAGGTTTAVLVLPTSLWLLSNFVTALFWQLPIPLLAAKADRAGNGEVQQKNIGLEQSWRERGKGWKNDEEI